VRRSPNRRDTHRESAQKSVPQAGHLYEEVFEAVKGKLIVTADDYGMCPSVNRAIEECLRARTVRVTCVMANMPECGGAWTEL